MKIFYHTGFSGHYPVGTSAIIRAKTKEDALKRLNEVLVENGLEGGADLGDMKEFHRGYDVIILQDGNY
jgi:hypothetical protein